MYQASFQTISLYFGVLSYSPHNAAEKRGVVMAEGVVLYLLGGDEKQLLGRQLFSALSSSYPTLSFSKTLLFNCLPASPASRRAPVSLPQDKGLAKKTTTKKTPPNEDGSQPAW